MLLHRIETQVVVEQQQLESHIMNFMMAPKGSNDTRSDDE
jgi:hypothetical protein